MARPESNFTVIQPASDFCFRFLLLLMWSAAKMNPKKEKKKKKKLELVPIIQCNKLCVLLVCRKRVISSRSKMV